MSDVTKSAETLAEEKYVGERPPSLVRQAFKLRRTQIGAVLALLLVSVALIGPFLAPFGSTE